MAKLLDSSILSLEIMFVIKTLDNNLVATSITCIPTFNFSVEIFTMFPPLGPFSLLKDPNNLVFKLGLQITLT